MNRALLFAALVLLPNTLPAQEMGAFTLLEGSVRVLRGTAVLRGVEGMRFQSGDIVETATPGFYRPSFPPGRSPPLARRRAFGSAAPGASGTWCSCRDGSRPRAHPTPAHIASWVRC